MQKVNSNSVKKRNSVIAIIVAVILVAILVFSMSAARNNYSSVASKQVLEIHMGIVVKGHLARLGYESLEHEVRLKNTTIDNCKEEKPESFYALSDLTKNIRCSVNADVIIINKFFNQQETHQLKNCPFVFARGKDKQSPSVALAQRRITSCL